MELVEHSVNFEKKDSETEVHTYTYNVWTSLDKSGQVWTSLDKSGQVRWNLLKFLISNDFGFTNLKKIFCV